MTISDTSSPRSGSAKGPVEQDESTASGDLSLAAALTRLNQALDGLDKTVEATIEERSKTHNADQQVQRMSDDRAKIARELDSAEARANRLKDVNCEVSRRLVSAMEMVRGVLDKQT